MLWLRLTFCIKKRRIWQFRTFWLVKKIEEDLQSSMEFETQETVYENKKLYCVELGKTVNGNFRNNGVGIFTPGFYDHEEVNMNEFINTIFET